MLSNFSKIRFVVVLSFRLDVQSIPYVTMVLEESSTFVSCLHKQIPFASISDEVRKQSLMTP